MKILHVDSAPGWRGGQNQVLLAASGMAARGHQVTVACRTGGVLEQRARQAGLDVRPVRFGGGDLSPRAILGLASVLRQTRPEIVQLHDPHAVAAGWLATRLGARIATVATRRVDFRLRGAPSRWKYASCKLVVTVSRAIAAQLERDGLATRDLRLVYEGVADRAAQPGGREALAELGVPADAPVVGNVAALTDHKDHATLLQAAAHVLREMPAAYFVIVGDGELRGRLEAQARALELGAHCIFAGFRNDLDRLIPAFTLFCLSSHMEGLGTSLLDAMCFARPLVVTRAGGMPEAVDEGVTGHVVPARDAAALARALTDLLGDLGRAREWGQAGRQRFERLFTAERMVDESLKVYQELL